MADVRVLPDDEVCACLDETGGRKVRLYERCERCGAFMEADDVAVRLAQAEQAEADARVQLDATEIAREAAVERLTQAEQDLDEAHTGLWEQRVTTEKADARLRELGQLAKNARALAASPDYDREAMRNVLRAILDAALAGEKS